MLNLDRIFSRTFIALSLSVAPVAAQMTWVVDDNGGPGVHFTTISAALAAAGPFDLIDVRPGQYTSFSVIRPARILGAPGAFVSGDCSVLGLPAGTWTFIADLSFERLRAFGVDGTLILDGLRMSGDGVGLSLEGCHDVRGHRLQASVLGFGGSYQSGGPKVRVHGGRAQLTDCDIRGAKGIDSFGQYGVPGQLGLSVTGGAFLHLDRCDVNGGAGGDNYDFGHGGDGADACRVNDGARLHCVGSIVHGGHGGLAFGGGYPFDGRGGVGLRASGGFHEAWDCQFEGGSAGGSSPQAPDIVLDNGAVLNSRELPSLVPVGTPHPSAPVAIELRTEPGAIATLLVARLPVIEAQPGASIPRLVDVGRVALLGAVPASGLLSVPLTMGPWPRGTVVFLQGQRNAPSGLEFTAAAALIVR